MKKQAWQLEREFRNAAVPVDRRVNPSKWEQGGEFPHGDALLRWFWNVQVPGSLAPDVFFQGMVQDWANQGYDVSEVEAMVPEGREMEASGRIEELRVLSARIMKALREAPKIAGHPYHAYEHPTTWEDVKAAMPAAKGYNPYSGWIEQFSKSIYQGWLGQLAGRALCTTPEG